MAAEKDDPRDKLSPRFLDVATDSCFQKLKFVYTTKVVVTDKADLDGLVTFGIPSDSKKIGKAMELQDEHARLVTEYDCRHRKLENFIYDMIILTLDTQAVRDYVIHKPRTWRLESGALKLELHEDHHKLGWAPIATFTALTNDPKHKEYIRVAAQKLQDLETRIDQVIELYNSVCNKLVYRLVARSRQWYKYKIEPLKD